MRFHIFVAVWGERFIRQFLDVALPSFLSADNLPALAAVGSSRLVCITRDEDREVLRAAPQLRRVAESMELRFLPIEPDRFETPYAAMTEAHYRAALEAHAAGAYAVFLGPDVILAEGALAAAAALVAGGKRVVLTAGLRLRDETARPALGARLAGEPGSTILRSRKLMRFALEHLHPESERLRYDSPVFTNDPITCLWPKGEEGLLLRSFHLHPLMVDLGSPRALGVLAHDTIDGAFVNAAFPNWRDIHVETDSDNILVFSLSSEADRREIRRRTQSNRMRLRCVAYQWNVNPLHRWLITHAIKLHTGDLDASWERLERETACEVAAALDIGKLSLSDYLRWRATVIFERLSLEIGRTRFWRKLHAWRVRLTG